MPTALSRIWTKVADSIFYDNSRLIFNPLQSIDFYPVEHHSSIPENAYQKLSVSQLQIHLS